MGILTYFLIFYGVMSAISGCILLYEVKHAYHVDPDECFLYGDAPKDLIVNNTK